MIIVKSVSMRNFMRFEQAAVSFARQGPTLICGQNLDNASSGSNGAGKSAVTEALVWGLYGKTVRGEPSRDIVRLGSIGGCCVTVDLDVAGTPYTITRYQDDHKWKNALQIQRDGVDLEAQKRGMQERLDQILGMDFDLFVQSVIVGQDAARFSQATDGEKKRILEGVAGLGQYDEYEENAKKAAQLLAQEYATATAAIRSADEEVVALKQVLDDTLAMADKQEAQRATELESLRAQLRELEASRAKVEEVRKDRDALAATVTGAGDPAEYQRLLGERGRIRAEEHALAEKVADAKRDSDQASVKVAELRGRWASLRRDTEAAPALQKELEEKALLAAGCEAKESELEALSADLSSHQQLLATAEADLRTNLAAGKKLSAEMAAIKTVCPTCQRPFDEAGIASAREAFQAKIRENAEHRIALEEEQKAMQQLCGKLLAQRDKLRVEVTSLRTASARVQAIQSMLAGMAGAQREMAVIQEQADGLKRQIDEREQTIIQAASPLMMKYSQERAVLDANIAAMEAAQKKANETQTQVQALDQQIARQEGLVSQIPELTARLAGLESRENEFRTAAERQAAAISTKEAVTEAKKAEAAEIAERKKYVEFWVKGFGLKGIRSLVMDRVAVFLTQRAAIYSSILTDGMIRIEFETQRQLQDGTWAEHFAVVPHNSCGAENYQGNSMGERQRVDLAVICAIRDLIRSRTGVSVKMLVADEVCSNVDAEGSERIMALLKHLSDEGDSVYFVTHDPAMQDLFQSRITVVKENGVSRILA